MEWVPPAWEPRSASTIGRAGSEWDLPKATAHVWRVKVEEAPGRWAAVLLPAETQRLSRFRLEADARREETGRGALRLLLGAYLGRRPADLEIVAGPAGKPALGPSSGAPEVRFNLSHSGEWVVLAFARNAEVGIDVERWHDAELASLARTAFAPEEVEQWLRLPPGERPAAFFDLWALKEAYLKALGLGLSKDPRSFRVHRGAEPRIEHCSDVPNAALRWRLMRLEAAPGYSCALAAEASIDRVRTFTLGS